MYRCRHPWDATVWLWTTTIYRKLRYWQPYTNVYTNHRLSMHKRTWTSTYSFVSLVSQTLTRSTREGVLSSYWFLCGVGLPRDWVIWYAAVGLECSYESEVIHSYSPVCGTIISCTHADDLIIISLPRGGRTRTPWRSGRNTSTQESSPTIVLIHQVCHSILCYLSSYPLQKVEDFNLVRGCQISWSQNGWGCSVSSLLGVRKGKG